MAGSVGVGGGTGMGGVEGDDGVPCGKRSVRTRSGVGEANAGMRRAAWREGARELARAVERRERRCAVHGERLHKIVTATTRLFQRAYLLIVSVPAWVI